MQELEADVTLTGGPMPAGAVRALVRDRAGRESAATCGAETWLTTLPQPVRGELPVVRFLDAHGELVRVPLPPGVKLAPVADAGEPCPVCGGVDWSRVAAAPPGRYGSDGSGRPTAAVCRRCGHEESLGVVISWQEVTSRRDPEAMARVEQQHACDLLALARTAPFTLVGLSGYRPGVVGGGRSGDAVDAVTLEFRTADGRVSVETCADEWRDPPESMARDTLTGMLRDRGGEDDGWSNRSDTAIALWMNARSRAHAAVAAAAPVRTLELPLAGEPTAFAAATHGERFAAVTHLPGAITVTITSTGRRIPRSSNASRSRPRRSEAGAMWCRTRPATRPPPRRPGARAARGRRPPRRARGRAQRGRLTLDQDREHVA